MKNIKQKVEYIFMNDLEIKEEFSKNKQYRSLFDFLFIGSYEMFLKELPNNESNDKLLFFKAYLLNEKGLIKESIELFEEILKRREKEKNKDYIYIWVNEVLFFNYKNQRKIAGMLKTMTSLIVLDRYNQSYIVEMFKIMKNIFEDNKIIKYMDEIYKKDDSLELEIKNQICDLFRIQEGISKYKQQIKSNERNNLEKNKIYLNSNEYNLYENRADIFHEYKNIDLSIDNKNNQKEQVLLIKKAILGQEYDSKIDKKIFMNLIREIIMRKDYSELENINQTNLPKEINLEIADLLYESLEDKESLKNYIKAFDLIKENKMYLNRISRMLLNIDLKEEASLFIKDSLNLKIDLETLEIAIEIFEKTSEKENIDKCLKTKEELINDKTY